MPPYDYFYIGPDVLKRVNTPLLDFNVKTCLIRLAVSQVIINSIKTIRP